MQPKSQLREYVLISLLGSAIGFALTSAYHAYFDLVWTRIMAPSMFRTGGLGSNIHERYSERVRKTAFFFELSDKASDLAVMKACLEYGPTGAIIGGVLGLAVATTFRRMHGRDKLNTAS